MGASYPTIRTARERLRRRYCGESGDGAGEHPVGRRDLVAFALKSRLIP